ncbi:MAG: response regulator [bacterium]|nr:response regulator [bacterium]
MTLNPAKAQTVLIADDDANFRFLIRKTLENTGFRVVEATNGDDACTIFEQQALDLVILDISMPGKDGFETCESIRNHQKGKAIPILIATGVDDVDSVQKAFDVGATDFIAKPVNWLTLGQRVKFVLRSHQETLELFKQESLNDAAFNRMPMWAGEEDSDDAPIQSNVLDHLRRLEKDTRIEFVDQLIESYFSEIPDLLSRVQYAYEANDRKALNELVIHVKTKSEMIGARRMSMLAREMEYAMYSNHWLMIQDVLDDLGRGLEITREAFRDLRKT